MTWRPRCWVFALASFAAAGVACESILVPDGETHKSWATLSDVLARAAEHYRQQLKASPRAVAYLKGRGLSGEDIEHAWGRRFAGYFLDDLSIPLERFHIAPRELAEMLPQQTLMLLAADGAGRAEQEGDDDGDTTETRDGLAVDLARGESVIE